MDLFASDTDDADGGDDEPPRQRRRVVVVNDSDDDGDDDGGGDDDSVMTVSAQDLLNSLYSSGGAFGICFTCTNHMRFSTQQPTYF